MVQHPGGGFLLVASRDRGGLAIGRCGSLRLDTGEVTGENLHRVLRDWRSDLVQTELVQPALPTEYADTPR